MTPRLSRVFRISGQASCGVGAHTHPGPRFTLFGAALIKRFSKTRCQQTARNSSPFLRPVVSPRLVCVGRLCEQKGQLLLLEACARLWQAGARFELVLVGDGPMRQEVERLAASLGIQEAVTITGWQDTSQVQELGAVGSCHGLAELRRRLAGRDHGGAGIADTGDHHVYRRYPGTGGRVVRLAGAGGVG